MTYWERFLIALKTNRCPIENEKDRRERERKEHLKRLYGQ